MMMLKQRPWVYAATGVLPLLPFVGLAKDLSMEARSAIALGLIGWWLVMGTLWLRRLDEAARLAHRWAWEWGGAVGVGLALMLAMLGWYAAPGLADAFGDFVQARSAHPEATAFFYGSAFTALLAVGLYACAWTGWWLSKRGGR